MNLAEILKANGLDETAANGILAAMKENKIYTASEENLDIRYSKLKDQHAGTAKELEELKHSAQDQAAMMQELTIAKQQVATLQSELNQAKTDAFMQVGLLEAGAKPEDIDYLMFELRKSGEMTLGEDGKINGWGDKVAGLKTRKPSNFANEKKKEYQENKLEKGDPGDNSTVTKEEFNKMGYNSKVALRQENPELYSQLTK